MSHLLKLQKICQIGLLWLFIGTSYLAQENDFIGYQLLEKQSKEVIKGSLILSDSPENINETGILYEEHLSGKARLLFHHLNEANKPLRFIIMLRNEERWPNYIEIKKSESVGPSRHVAHCGKVLLEKYFKSCYSKNITVPAKGEMILFDSQKTTWKTHELLTGILDFATSGKATIVTAVIEPQEEIATLKLLPYLEKDGHPRGTFSVLEQQYTLHLPNFGKYYICMEQEEDWAIGKDGITQEITMNKGNYGIMYHITIQTEADTKVQFVPRAGVFKGVIKWNKDDLCPIERVHYFKHCKEPVDLGILKAHETNTLSYMLPNGSAAPVWLQFEILENIEG